MCNFEKIGTIDSIQSYEQPCQALSKYSERASLEYAQVYTNYPKFSDAKDSNENIFPL